MSSRQTSRFIGPVVRWLCPDISTEAQERIVFVVRKAAHVTEYAILGMLLWRAQRRPRRQDDRPWDWKMAGWSLLICLAYALSDELHQWFVPSRGPHFGDVLLDTLGAAGGLLLIWMWGRWMKKQW